MIRITGLVRVFNQVRSNLQVGLAPEDVKAFRELVAGTVRQVEEICARHGRPAQVLPGPSRMAYQFLKDLDLDNLPLRAADQVVEPRAPVRVRNVVGIAESTARQLWLNRGQLLSSATAREELVDQLRHHTGSVDKICRQHGQTPSALEVRTRGAYTYLSFVSNIDNLQNILAALVRAEEAGRDFTLPPSIPLEIHLLGMNSLWRFRRYANATILKANLGFLQAETSVWRAMLSSALIPNEPGRGRQMVTEFALSEEFNDILFEVESLAAPPAPITRGRIHDLQESFERVNRAYFNGHMERPILGWNQTLTSSKFGHYQPSRDSVMISVSLDSPEVPAALLDFVMYHELLHKKHGSTTLNGRRVVHSPAFRADERLFQDWEKAEAWLNQLARQQAARR